MRLVLVDPACFSPPYDHCLAEALAKQGVEVTLARSPFGSADWAADGSYTVWDRFYPIASRLKQLGALRKLIKGVDHMLSMRRFCSYAERVRPDVIHFEWLPLPAVDLRFLPRLRRIAPLALTVHDSNPFHGSPTSKLQNIGAARALGCFDRLVAHTEYTKRQLVAQGIPEERIRVIPHGAFDYYQAIARPAAGDEAPSPPTLVFFGSIKPYKGVDLLLRAFAALPPELRASAKLVIAGTPGMDLSPLRSLARQLQIEARVEWRLGFIAEEEVAPLLRNARGIVLPYREIDQSGVLLAAIGVGIPIIATAVGGIPETIQDGVHGFLVAPEDVAALTRSMEALLREPNRAIEMRKALAELAKSRLSWAAIAQRTVQMYEDLAAARGNSRQPTKTG